MILRDARGAMEAFEAAGLRYVPMTRRRRFWLRMRKLAVLLGSGRLYWFCSRKVWS